MIREASGALVQAQTECGDLEQRIGATRQMLHREQGKLAETRDKVLCLEAALKRLCKTVK